MSWKVVITANDDGSASFVYDGKVDRYRLVGLMEVEIGIIKEELREAMKRRD